MLNRPLPAPARDIAMLIARVILGVVLFAHGWQKLIINGISGTYGQFEQLGIPLAIVSASFASFVEFVGGVLIVVGALTTTVVALDLVVMVGAAGFVHITHGIFAQNGGWELVGVIVAAELALAAFGPGRFSVDHFIASLRDREAADMERRKRTPVRRAVAVSEAFTPAVEARRGGCATDPGSVGVPTGAFAAIGLTAGGSTGSVAPTSAVVASGAAAATAPTPSTTTSGGAFGAGSAAAGGSAGAFAPPEAERVSAESPTGAFARHAGNRASADGPTGAFQAVSRAATAISRATHVADQPVTEAFATVTTTADRAVDASEPAKPTEQAVVETSPRMASAGVARAMAEQSAGSGRPAPAPFGVVVQSPLDFTPTAALPVVPPAPELFSTDTITIATSTPGGLPRRVRAVDLPPASAVRPYA